MATFLTPDRALAAALRMREAMRRLNETHGREDLLLKIGIHEGPCLAVNLNERQDYFGQTVNIASRVQGLAMSRSILATAPVVDNPRSAEPARQQWPETGGAKPRAARHRRRKSPSMRSPERFARALALTQIGRVRRQTGRAYPSIHVWA